MEKEGQGMKGRSEAELHVIKTDKIMKVKQITLKLLIFIFSSKELPYLCFCSHCFEAVPYILKKKPTTEMIRTKAN